MDRENLYCDGNGGTNRIEEWHSIRSYMEPAGISSLICWYNRLDEVAFLDFGCRIVVRAEARNWVGR